MDPRGFGGLEVWEFDGELRVRWRFGGSMGVKKRFDDRLRI